MTPYVIDVDERGAPVQRAHGFDGKIVRDNPLVSLSAFSLGTEFVWHWRF
jgi:hypothetical protein